MTSHHDTNGQPQMLPGRIPAAWEFDLPEWVREIARKKINQANAALKLSPTQANIDRLAAAESFLVNMATSHAELVASRRAYRLGIVNAYLATRAARQNAFAA